MVDTSVPLAGPGPWGEASKEPRAHQLRRHSLSGLHTNKDLLKRCALDACLPHCSPSPASESRLHINDFNFGLA